MKPKLNKPSPRTKMNRKKSLLDRVIQEYGKDFGTMDFKKLSKALKKAGYPALEKLICSREIAPKSRKR